MMLIRFVAVLGLLLGSTAFGQQTTTPRLGKQRQSSQSSQSTKENDATYAALIEQLVLTDQDEFVEGGQTYLRRESSARINKAAITLSQAGKKCWPVVMNHLDDKRASTPASATTGPHDVGRQCYHILRSQIVSLPRGFPRGKISPEFSLDEMFKPSMIEWVLARKDKELEEMQIEVLEYVIALERRSNWKVETKAETLAKFESHLAELKEQVQRAATKAR